MLIDVVMPQLGESVVEGVVVKWLVEVGELVAKDHPLLEISTDKVDAEIPSPTAGVVEALLAAEGDVVAVGAPLVRIGSGEGAKASPAKSTAAAGHTSRQTPQPSQAVASTT